MAEPELTVIVPVYNEEATVGRLLERVLSVPIPKQVVVVDDGSRDGSRAALERIAQGHPEVELAFHEVNRGKGAAIHTGLARARGTYTIIQDADLEYDPADYQRLLAVARERGARVVYGSRILARQPYSYRSYYWGGRLVSLVASLLYGQRITDEPTCYKLFETGFLKSLPLREKGFGFCPEATALACRRGERIIEVPITYAPRSRREGKKIRWSDGLAAIWILLKHRWKRRR